MCTAATYKTKDFYFGRTLDVSCSYFEQITITPRNYPFRFTQGTEINSHYAIIGMAYVESGYPLYYDAVNEKGLCIAGLNFKGNAEYHQAVRNKDNIAQFELIPWLLCQCSSVDEAKVFLEKLNLVPTPFRDNLPIAKLHWLLADAQQAITIECVHDGIHIYDNPVGILTNNPPFPFQMFNLNNYMQLSVSTPKNHFSPALDLKPYSLGMGAMGLPGDFSSLSRFVRAAFVKMHSVSDSGEKESVSQFFHILNSVNQPRGCCVLEDNHYEITVYTSCCNAVKGIYYYTHYDNHQITAVDLHKEDLNCKELVCYPLICEEQIKFQN